LLYKVILGDFILPYMMCTMNLHKIGARCAI